MNLDVKKTTCFLVPILCAAMLIGICGMVIGLTRGEGNHDDDHIDDNVDENIGQEYELAIEEQIIMAENVYPDELEVKLDAVGTLVAVWAEGITADNGKNTHIRIALLDPATMEMKQNKPVELLEQREVDDFDMDVSRESNTYYLIWNEPENISQPQGNQSLLFGKSLNRGDSFISGGHITKQFENFDNPSLVVGTQEKLYCTYLARNGENEEFEFYLSTSTDRGNSFEEPMMISNPARNGCGGGALYGDGQYIYCVWLEENEIMFARSTLDNISFGPEKRIDHTMGEGVKLDHTINFGTPVVQGNDNTSLAVVWNDNREKEHWQMLFISHSENNGDTFFNDWPPAMNNTQLEQKNGNIDMGADNFRALVYTNWKDIYLYWSQTQPEYATNIKICANARDQCPPAVVQTPEGVFVVYNSLEDEGAMLMATRVNIVPLVHGSEGEEGDRDESGWWDNMEGFGGVLGGVPILTMVGIILFRILLKRKKGKKGKKDRKKAHSTKKGHRMDEAKKTKKTKKAKKRKKGSVPPPHIENFTKEKEDLQLALELLENEKIEGGMGEVEYLELKNMYQAKLSNLNNTKHK